MDSEAEYVQMPLWMMTLKASIIFTNNEGEEVKITGMMSV